MLPKIVTMRGGEVDQNLLFGVLAVQQQIISPDDLIRAASLWADDERQSLSDVLRKCGFVTDEQVAELNQLLAGKRSHAVTSDLPPQDRSTDESDNIQATLDHTPVGDFATLDHTPADDHITELTNEPPSLWATPSEVLLGDTEGAGEIYHPSSDPQALRFKKVRFHDKGGLGEIHVALDRELPREVALKEIKPRYANVHSSRERFAQEARITGALEHPGIVPVYGLGQYADGQLYYAMRFIEGETLSKAIARYHKGEATAIDHGEKRLAFRKLLDQFIDVCQVINYAHDRGIIHRDIKPDNIMLGPYGETLVVDWGLAKRVGEDDVPVVGEEDSARHVKIRNASTTLPGSVVGTPAYMSPEQATGTNDAVGPCSDIYSLGATFYRLLTGLFPFQGETALEQVCQGDFKPPHEVARGVPPTLEAICLKAMALAPEDRYVSAGAMADDVHRYLADEPVSVYREPMVQRALRFARRHKVAVSTTSALIVTLFLGLTIWSEVEAFRDRDALDEVREKVTQGEVALREQQFSKALSLFAEAEGIAEKRTSLQALYASTKERKEKVEDVIANQKEFKQSFEDLNTNIDDLRAKAFEDDLIGARDLGREIYSDFVSSGLKKRLTENSLDAMEGIDSTRLLEYRRKVAEALVQLANLEVRLAPEDKKESTQRSALQRLGEAEQIDQPHWAISRMRADYLQALGEIELLKQEEMRLESLEPNSALDFRAKFDKALNQGNLKGQDGKSDGALDYLKRALEEEPSDYLTLLNLASLHSRLGQSESNRDEIARGIESCDQAIRLRPGESRPYAMKADLLVQLGDFDGAISQLEKAESKSPGDFYIFLSRGNLFIKQAAQINQRRASPSQLRTKEKLLDQAINQFKQSFSRNPTPWAKVNQAEALEQKAQLLAVRGGPQTKDEVERERDLAIAAYTEALQEYPDYVAALRGRAKARMEGGELEAAFQDLVYAQRSAPKDPKNEYILGLLLDRQSRKDFATGQLSAGNEKLHRAERYFDRALRMNPLFFEAQFGRGRVRYRLWQNQLNHQRTRSDVQKLSGVGAAAITDLQSVSDSLPSETLVQLLGGDRVADLYKMLGDLKAYSRRNDEAELDYQTAIQYGYPRPELPLRLGWSRLTNDESILDQFDRLLMRKDLSTRQRAEAHIGRGIARVRLGQDKLAIEDAAAAISLAEQIKNSGKLKVIFNAAGIYALAAEIAEQEHQDAALADERAKKSIDLLKQVIDKGLPNRQLILQNRDFLPLLRRDDFQRLLRD